MKFKIWMSSIFGGLGWINYGNKGVVAGGVGGIVVGSAVNNLIKDH